MMRNLFLALLIALLPLRGWVGDAMAMDLLAPALPGPAAHALTDHADPTECEHASSQHGHEGAAAHHTPEHDDHADHGTADCVSHGACQICHSVALAVGQARAAKPALAAPMLPAPLARFASADPVPGFKPPICRL